MQGQKSSISSLPDNLRFDPGSSSIDGAMNTQLSWNSLQTATQNGLPDCRMSSSDPNILYLQRPRHEGQNSEWNIGESSYGDAQNQGDQIERKTEHTWSICPRAALTLEEQRCEPSNIVSIDSVDSTSDGNRAANGPFPLSSASSDTLHRDLNMNSGFEDLEDDDCWVIERPNTFKSIGSSHEKMPCTGSSSDPFAVSSGCRGYSTEGNDDMPGCSLDGRRVSCKRKAFEVQTGQSSGVGSSNCFQHVERRPWHTVPSAQNSASSFGSSTQAEGNIVMNNRSEQGNSRISLGVGGDLSASPFSLTDSGAAESSHRNFRLRSGSHQQDSLPSNLLSAHADVGQIHFSSSQNPSTSLLDNSLFDFIPAPAGDNRTLHGQSALLRIPSVHQNHQSRWNGGVSSSRTSSLSSPFISGERDSGIYEESTARNMPRSISEHPIFVPAREMRSSSRHPTNWNFTGGNNNIAGNMESTSRMGSSPNFPQYPRRLSEIVRRSLLSTTGNESGGQTSNHAIRSSSSATLQDMALSSGSGSRGQQLPNSRSALLERHLDGAIGIPYSLRTLASAGEGRRSVMSEIRHVLDLMRRGEGLRLEDVMILDHSVFFGMADIHDRHRDMRLDVDNMSYEELLALEERIGNVCTGLSEETIMSRLKQHKYVNNQAEDGTETEPCSICREEYNDGEDLGKLECGHDFHNMCIKQWLVLKNSCPICKTTGLTT